MTDTLPEMDDTAENKVELDSMGLLWNVTAPATEPMKPNTVETRDGFVEMRTDPFVSTGAEIDWSAELF